MGVNRCTPTYLLYLETDIQPLFTRVLKQALQFISKILSIEHTRYTRICFEALRERAHEGVAKYNWVTQVQDLLDSLGYYGLCNESDGRLLNDLKQDIVTAYKNKRQEDDITEMRSSHNFCYYEELLSDSNEQAQYINFNLPKWEFALCAQMRITNGKFYLDKKTLSLDEDKFCPLCNKGSFDILHIIYDFKILGYG